jgi:hypothetical protein
VETIETINVIFISGPQGKSLIETVDSVLPLSRPAGMIPPAPTLAEMALQSFFWECIFWNVDSG